MRAKPNSNNFKKVKPTNILMVLQVKFSYAITCHKSQGGQWNTVFIEQPYLPDGINRDYIRCCIQQ
jgi:ATP-dependent exoDNAse (exonuclease V) alpha subunit